MRQGDKEMERRQSWREWLLNSPVLRLQVSVTLILTVILTLMTVVIWKQTTTTQCRQVEYHSLMVRKGILARVYDRMFSHISIAAQDNELVARRFRIQPFAGKDEKYKDFDTKASQLLWPRFMMKDLYLAYLFTRDADGGTVGYQRLDNTSVLISSIGNGNYTIDTFVADRETGDSLSPLPSLGVHDFREGLWSIMQYPYLTTHVNLHNWGSYVYLYVTTRVTEEIQVDPSTNDTSTYGINGTLQGMYALDLLSQFTSNMSMLGEMFACTEDGLIVALSSNNTRPFKEDPVTKVKTLIKATEVTDTVLAGAARWLEHRCNYDLSLLKDAPLYASNVKINGHRYFVDTATVDFPLMNIVLVVVTPRYKIMRVVDESSRKIAIIMSCVSISFLAVGVSLLLVVTKHMGNEVRLKKELSQQLEAKERAEACTASARLFLANLSHDLRTPMAAIIGLLEIMSENGLDVEQRVLIEQVQSNADALHTLLNSVLDISKVEAGRLELVRAPFDIQQELESIVDLFSVEGLKKGVDVLLDLPEDLPKVYGDCSRFRQIFANLLSNSVRFTPTGSVVIRGLVLQQGTTTAGLISCRSTLSTTLTIGPKPESLPQRRMISIVSSLCNNKLEKVTLRSLTGRRSAFQQPPTSPKSSGRASGSISPLPSLTDTGQGSIMDHHEVFTVDNGVTLVFEVEDTGSNISAEDREAMFQNFIALPNNSTRYGSTGIGLGIVRSLVQLMGGSISIIEKETPGVLFRFTITLEKQGETVAGPPSRGTSRTSASLILQPAAGAFGFATHPVCPLHHVARNNATKKLPSTESGPPKEFSVETTRGARKILLVMPEGKMQSEVASRWFDCHNCEVSTESCWEKLKAAVEAMCLGLRDRTDLKSDLAVGKTARQADKDGFQCLILVDCALIPNEKERGVSLQHLRSLGENIQGLKDIGVSTNECDAFRPPRMAAVLLITPATPPLVQRAAKSAGWTLLQKPLIPSRLAPLLSFFHGVQGPTSRDNSSASLIVSQDKLSDAAPLQGTYCSSKLYDVDHHYHKTMLPTEVPETRDAQTESASALRKLNVLTTSMPVKETMTVGRGKCKNEPALGSLTSTAPTTGIVEQGPESTSRSLDMAGFTSKESLRPQIETPQASVPKDPTSQAVEERGEILCERQRGTPEDKKEAPRNSQLKHGGDFKGIRILLVEDTPVMAQIATKQMEKIGAKVKWAQDGQVAVDIFKESYCGPVPKSDTDQSSMNSNQKASSPKEGFDVIVMDCQMPRMDGYAATAAIRELEKVIGIRTPIIALTAHAMTTDRQKCLDAGMDDYLVKPLNMNLFKSMLEKILRPKAR